MKTILRLSIIVLMIVLIGIGIVALFENPSVQNLLGLETGTGRGGRAAEADRDLFEWEGAVEGERGNGQRHGFGGGQGRGSGFGRHAEEGEWRGEHIAEFPSSAGWLGLVGILLRLAILMAVVVALVRLERWIRRKFKPNGRMKAENASLS